MVVVLVVTAANDSNGVVSGCVDVMKVTLMLGIVVMVVVWLKKS